MQAQPESIGPYLLETELGSGSHGRVYKAWDPRLSRWVAIKLLYDFQADSLTSEAKLLAELNHPNIVVVYDLLTHHGMPALVMEYLPGDNLAARLQRQGALPWQHALELTRQIAAGLDAAHSRQIIHGDLKPENLIFDQQDQLKIGDFGIARREWQPGQAFGSCLSISPEQLRGEAAGKQSDLYAVGLLLYRMLTGDHPFEQEDEQADMFARMLNSPCPKVDGVPESVNNLLASLLAADPANRPASAADLVQQLSPSPVSQDPTLLHPPVIVAPQPRGISPWLWGAVASMLVLVAGWWFWPVTPTYVLAPRPQITAGEDIEDLPLIRAAVYQGITEALTRQQDTRLIELPGGIAPSEQDWTRALKQTAADQMLISELACQQDECALTLSHVDAESRLIKRDTLRFPTENLLFIGDYVQRYWQVDQSEQAQASNEADYRKLLTLHESYQAKEIGRRDYLNLLEPYGCRFQLSCRELLRLYKREARSQRQSEWLDKADALLDSADFGFQPRFLDIDAIYLALLRSDFERADKLLNSLEGLFFTDDLVLGLRARWYFEQGFDVKGLAMMARLAEQRPSALNRFNYALMHYRLGQYNEAADVLQALSLDMPQFIRARELLADILLSRGHWSEAASKYAELLALPELKTWTNYVNLGVALMMQSELKAAERELMTAFQLAPDNPVTIMNLADVKFLQNQESESSILYEKILTLFKNELPQSSWEYLALAQAHARLYQEEQANQALLKVLKESATDPLLSFNIALVYLFLGDKEVCYSYLGQAVEAGLPLNWLSSPWLASLEGDSTFERLKVGEIVRVY
ncbi:protein kinase [Shewanella submarina]|uniref:Protein kinase n=1 Tax=Shewanella submarina TaxID=2016376 RepID=A0ABV7GCR2_9GAMM|nr:serine/threonine-protein kinase [Shewanella submarina]MCL1039856.1 protein kinase [Shewanella submarina]